MLVDHGCENVWITGAFIVEGTYGVVLRSAELVVERLQSLLPVLGIDRVGVAGPVPQRAEYGAEHDDQHDQDGQTAGGHGRLQPCHDRPTAPLRDHLIWLSKLLVVSRIVERLVPDELWELFQRVVPEAPSRPQGGGRRRHGDREVLAAIVFVATSGCTWQQLPAAAFGPSGATAHRRFTEWTKARVWAKLHRLVLDELGARGDLDWSRCAIDSVNMRALKRGS